MSEKSPGHLWGDSIACPVHFIVESLGLMEGNAISMKKSLDDQECLLYWVIVGGVWWKLFNMAACYVGEQHPKAGTVIELTITLHKVFNLLCVVNTSIIHHKHTPWTRVWV